MNFNPNQTLIRLIDKYNELDVPMKFAIVLLFLSPSIYWGSMAYRNFKEPIVIRKTDTVYVNSKPIVDTFVRNKTNIDKAKYNTTINNPVAPVHIGPNN